MKARSKHGITSGSNMAAAMSDSKKKKMFVSSECYVVSCYVVVCYVVLCSAVLFCVASCCVVLCYVV